MNTQEAIEIVCVGREKLLTFEETHKVVECLREGEKYRQMWEEFKKCCSLSIVFDGKLQNIKDKMNWFEQKYFPKGDN